jgi:hypothetical protein
MHPSELGHRRLARLAGELLVEEGLRFGLPSMACTGEPPRRRDLARTLVADVAPWLGRRVRDLGPWSIGEATRRTRELLRRATTRGPLDVARWKLELG